MDTPDSLCLLPMLPSAGSFPSHPQDTPNYLKETLPGDGQGIPAKDSRKQIPLARNPMAGQNRRGIFGRINGLPASQAVLETLFTIRKER
jgi:hypothetical protein